jgi:hypothetical protein
MVKAERKFSFIALLCAIIYKNVQMLALNLYPLLNISVGLPDFDDVRRSVVAMTST